MAWCNWFGLIVLGRITPKVLTATSVRLPDSDSVRQVQATESSMKAILFGYPRGGGMLFCRVRRLVWYAAFGVLTHATAQSQPFTNTLMPQPAKLTVGQGKLPLSPSLTTAVPHFRDDRLNAGIHRMLRQLEMQTGVQILNLEIDSVLQETTLVIDVQEPGGRIQSVDEDESYSLTITQSHATLKAATVVGALRGMETLLQLVQRDETGYSLPVIRIEDAPRFRWRGLLIDSGRHFEPIDVIKRTLDGMAAVKLNVLHWHLTEDQGFRIESKLFPKLTGMGSDGLYYTQAQAKEIVAYARERGIRVVPEFDMPGHSRSWFVGYPQLASAPGSYNIRREFGIDDAAMDPTCDSTYKFIDAFLGEMATIFPDPCLHIGGDESNGEQWKSNPRIVEFMRQHNLQDTAALQTYFNKKLVVIIQRHGKHMVGWDEILSPGLPKGVLVESWRGTESLATVAKQGYQGILAAPYYLNVMESAEQHYLADPLPATLDLSAREQQLVLGGEACMWGEYVYADSIDSRVWPRLAAIAERFWSPKKIRDVDDMYCRLDVMSMRLEALGLTHLTHEDAALRSLAGTTDITALRLFASLVEPAGIRHHHPYVGPQITQLTPLDHFSDAVRPDPPSRHRMQALVQSFLQDPHAHGQERHELEASFQAWIAATPKLEEQIAQSPLLHDVQPRVLELPELATTGLEALRYLETGSSAPTGWKRKTFAELDEVENLNAPVYFTVIEPLRSLVSVVEEQP